MLHPQHFYNIFTKNHRWLVVISSNLNLTLRLLFYSNNNNQSLRICCKNVVKMFLPFIKKFVLPLLPKMISVILERYINNEERYQNPLSTKSFTTKKRGYPSVFKSAGIAPKSAGIGSKFLSRRFFSRRSRPPLFECGDRVVRTCTSAFQKRWDRSRRFQTLFRRF